MRYILVMKLDKGKEMVIKSKSVPVKSYIQQSLGYRSASSPAIATNDQTDWLDSGDESEQQRRDEVPSHGVGMLQENSHMTTQRDTHGEYLNVVTT